MTAPVEVFYPDRIDEETGQVASGACTVKREPDDGRPTMVMGVEAVGC